jgi:dienelactone hydrolase
MQLFLSWFRFAWILTVLIQAGCAVTPSKPSGYDGTSTVETITVYNVNRSRNVEVDVAIYRPSRQNPAQPAVVLMTGCSGEATLASSKLVAELGARGVAVAEVLSIQAFGYSCTVAQPLSSAARTEHALLARELLVRRGLAAVDNVGLLGFSHGGSTVLHLVLGDFPPNYQGDRTPFRAAVAFYPHCGTLTGTGRVVTPALLLLGSADNWTLASSCLRLASEHPEADGVRAIVYEGATHSWDMLGGTRTLFNGAILAFDPAATEASIRAAEEFMLDRLRR